MIDWENICIHSSISGIHLGWYRLNNGVYSYRTRLPHFYSQYQKENLRIEHVLIVIFWGAKFSYVRTEQKLSIK